MRVNMIRQGRRGVDEFDDKNTNWQQAHTQFADDTFYTVYGVHRRMQQALPTWFVDLLPMFLDFSPPWLVRLIAQLILHFGRTCRTNCNPFGRSRRGNPTDEICLA